MEAQFLHVLVARAVQRIHARPTQLRPKDFKNRNMGQKLVLDGLRQRLELGHELVVEIDDPAHS